MTKEEKKHNLIGYLRYLSKKPHILSRHTFQIYIGRLENDKYLTEKMITHIIKFLRRDSSMSESELWDYMYDFTSNYHRGTHSTSTLEPFLT